MHYYNSSIKNKEIYIKPNFIHFKFILRLFRSLLFSIYDENEMFFGFTIFFNWIFILFSGYYINE
mgnify:CR=1 FL=1